MASITCCWLWLLVGIVLGWLGWQALDVFFRRDGEAAGHAAQRKVEDVENQLSGMKIYVERLQKMNTEAQAQLEQARRAQAEAEAKAAETETIRQQYEACEEVRRELQAQAQAQTEALRVLTEENASLKLTLTAAPRDIPKDPAKFGFSPRKNGEDDIIIIEGIGPKIRDLLHAANIRTFRALADTPVADLQSILTAAGPNYRLANPGTWPRQAELCVQGDWEALRHYQDELTIGIDKRNKT